MNNYYSRIIINKSLISNFYNPYKIINKENY